MIDAKANTVYLDPLARCIVFIGSCRDRKKIRQIAFRRFPEAPADWPVVRQGPEHERRHQAVMANDRPPRP